MAETSLNLNAASQQLCQMIQDKFKLTTRPQATLMRAPGDMLFFTSANIRAGLGKKHFKDAYIIGKGFNTAPEDNIMGTIATLTLFFSATLVDGHDADNVFAQVDLFADGTIAFHRFRDLDTASSLAA